MHPATVTFKFLNGIVSTIELSLETVEMPITQLQCPIPEGLSPRNTVGDALERFQKGEEDCESASEVIGALSKRRRGNGSIDWLGYWELRKNRFIHLRMSCVELDRLAKAHEYQPINRETFGKAGITLSKNGITTIGVLAETLAEGLPDMWGFGKTKSEELFVRLVKYVRLFESGEPVFFSSSDEKGSDVNSGAQPTPIDYKNLDSLSETTRSLPLSAIHLEKKSKMFADAGLKTLGNLVDISKSGFPSIRSVGKATISQAIFVLTAISKSVNAEGGIDCAAFTQEAGIPMIPKGRTPTSGKEFIALLPSVFDELIDATNDERDRDIFVNRLKKKRLEQKTLEQLSRRAGVTRERIRQKEKVLLERISDALLYDEYPTLEYRFSPSFSRYFKQAAEAFADEDQEIRFERFMVRLEKTWQTPIEEILPHMALITAILTQKSVKPAELRVDRSVPPAFWDSLPEAVAKKPVRQLRLGKSIAFFDDNEIETLGEAIEAMLAGLVSDSNKKSGFQRLREILKTLARALEEADQESSLWKRYAVLEGMEVLPEREMTSPSEFVNCVHKTLRAAVCKNSTLKHSSEVFDLRTSKPKMYRYTLSKASESIGIVAPTVKRVETEFVKLLNAQMVEKDFTESNVFFRKSFLMYWSEANAVYQATNEFSRFKFSLERRWGLSQGRLDETADLMWTILNIYPNGRNVTHRNRSLVGKKTMETSTPPTSGVIKLRGFRRVY